MSLVLASLWRVSALAHCGRALVTPFRTDAVTGRCSWARTPVSLIFQTTDPKHSHAGRTFRAMTVLRNVCAYHGRIWNRSHGVELKGVAVAMAEKTTDGVALFTPEFGRVASGDGSV